MKGLTSAQIARIVDAYCAAHGISKAEFTKKTGVSSATLSQWRKGVYKPSEKAMDAIARFIGAPLDSIDSVFQPPDISDDNVTFPVIGEVAAGYDHIAYDGWTGDSIEIPRSCLHGRGPTDFFVLRVQGDSMYPDYHDGDHVLVLRQSTMDRSGQVGVVIYGDENATLKRVEYVVGEDWMTLRPINPQYPPVTIRDEALEHCKVLGVAKLVVRELEA